jgi:PAS domain S-box-containing protein
MKVSENAACPVLILTPTGRDGTLAAEALAEAGVASRICEGLPELCNRVGEDAAAVLLAEEALSAAELPQFLERLRAQPPWSDLPLLILTTAGRPDDAAIVEILKLFGPSGNVTLLERPLRSVVLVSTVQVALRARLRQYEVRDLLAERETVLTSISDAFSALDRDWRYVYVNDKVAELAGRPKEKMIGRVIWDVFPEAVGTTFDKLAHIAMDEGRSTQDEFFYEPWGRWVDTRIYPSKNGIVIFRGDVTERKEQERLARERETKLRESQERLRLAT